MLREAASPLSENDAAIFTRLGKRLLNCGFGMLLRSYREVGQRVGALEFDRTFLIPELGDLIDLFCSCKSVKAEVAVAAIGAEEISTLVKYGIIAQKQGLLRTVGLRLIDHFGIFLFVGHQSTLNTLYFGDDSTALGSWLLGAPRGRSLDLCCGVGAQTILCASRSGGEAVGVERNNDAIRIAYINAALNGLAAKVRFCEGDVLDTFPAIDCVSAQAVGRFDTVCCNPPLLPVPPEVPFPAVANGGGDGLSFLAAILPALPTLLGPEGRCYIIGTILGSDGQPDLSRIRKIIDDCSLCAFMVIPSVVDMRRGEPFRKMLEYTSVFSSPGSGVRDLNGGSETWDVLNAHGSHLYSFCLVVTRAKVNEQSRLSFTSHFERNENFWFV